MRPLNKGSSPYADIKEYGETLPYLEERIGSYCSYCGLPLAHAPEVEHIISKSKAPQLQTKWENLLLGCKYCNTRKSNRVDLNNFDEYLWPDVYNTAVAFGYAFGIPRVNTAVLQELDPSGEAKRRAENLFSLIKLGEENGKGSDRRDRKRNEVYQEATMARERWSRNRNEDMKAQIIATAISYGFFSVWATVFAGEPELLCALIEAFPGTAKEFYDENGLPKPMLQRVQEPCTI